MDIGHIYMVMHTSYMYMYIHAPNYAFWAYIHVHAYLLHVHIILSAPKYGYWAYIHVHAYLLHVDIISLIMDIGQSNICILSLCYKHVHVIATKFVIFLPKTFLFIIPT